MPHAALDTYHKAVLDAGISGKDWRKHDAFDDFTRFYNGAYTEDQRLPMKYDEILAITKAWWNEHRSKYS